MRRAIAEKTKRSTCQSQVRNALCRSRGGLSTKINAKVVDENTVIANAVSPEQIHGAPLLEPLPGRELASRPRHSRTRWRQRV